jgi:hypothetical protein
MKEVFIEIRDGVLSIQAPGIETKKEQVKEILKSALALLETQEALFVETNELVFKK